MKRAGKVLYKGQSAGVVWQDDDGYGFIYEPGYLEGPDKSPISLTLPLRSEPYLSKTMIPFFDGLIPEGWLLDITVKNWKLNPADRMELILTVCKDCLGAVSIERIKTEEEE
jgi:serine/threonine-protein kinase HipA